MKIVILRGLYDQRRNTFGALDRDKRVIWSSVTLPRQVKSYKMPIILFKNGPRNCKIP